MVGSVGVFDSVCDRPLRQRSLKIRFCAVMGESVKMERKKKIMVE